MAEREKVIKRKKVVVLKNDVLLKIRKQLGLSQVKMAELCNVASPTYQYWELGFNNPRQESIDKLAILLEENEELLKENGLPYKVDDLFCVETIEMEEEDNPYLFLGFKLKQLRQAENIKQSDYAKILNVHASTISKFERGASFCSFEFGEKIAKSFGIANYMEFYVEKEEVYRKILQNEIPIRYVKKFVKEGLVLNDDVENPKWNEENLKNLARFKLLKLYRYYLKLKG